MSHSMAMDTEARRGGGIFPKPWSKLKLDVKLEPRTPEFYPRALSMQCSVCPLKALTLNCSVRHWCVLSLSQAATLTFVGSEAVVE